LTGYRAPWWLPGAHAQTILPSLVRWPWITWNRYNAEFLRWPCITYTREYWATPPWDKRELRPDPPLRPEQLPDEDFIHVDSVGEEAAANWLVLFHGAEGSSQAVHARRLAARGLADGWYLGMPNFRSCSGRPNLQLRDYHAGCSDEIDWILRRFRQRHGGKLYVAGVSLGANALLKWLGQMGDKALEVVHGAVSVSATFDLRVTGANLARGFSRLYAKHSLANDLRAKAREKLKRFPGAYDARRVCSAGTLRDFEDAVIAPVNGFRDVADYYARASAGPWLRAIRVPTLILNARNDPFMAEHALDAAQRENPSRPGSPLTFEFPLEGGHAGFADGCGWLVERIFRFFAQLPASDSAKRAAAARGRL
jgi:predicted alpha/beta-fold hydrolase